MHTREEFEALTVEETAGVSRVGELLRFGVPFAPGEWQEGDEMGFSCHALRGAGRVCARHWDILHRWKDGSVRLAFCTLSLDVEAQSLLALRPDASLQHAEIPVLVPSEQHAAIECEILGDAGAETTRPAVLQGHPGWAELSPTMLYRDRFEITGEIRRIGQDSFVLAVTVRNATLDACRIARLRFSVDARRLLHHGAEDCGVQLDYARANIRREYGDTPHILQLTHESVFTANGMTPIRFAYPIGGECRQNLVSARAYTSDDGITITVRNLGENFPSKLSLGDKRIFFDLHPEEAGPFDWPSGMSKTWEFGVARDEGGQAAGGISALLPFQHPLVPTIPIDRLSLLECFPELAAHSPKEFSRVEFWIKWVLANRPRAYGSMHFGDEPNFGYTARSQDGDGIITTNNEYDFPFIALTEFCRTGDRIWYEDGRAAALHMMDIDSVTVSENPLDLGGQYAHAVRHGCDRRYVAPDHEWLEGLLLWYMISADRRALQRARALADRLVRLTEQGDFDTSGQTARRYGWPLIALCAFHAFQQDDRYLTAARRIVEGMRRVEEEMGGLRSPYWGTPYRSADTFMIGVALAGLVRFHRLTNEADVAAMILRGCDEVMGNLSPEGIFHYKSYPLVRLPDPVSSSIALEALAYGYRLSGNMDYLTAGLGNIEALLAIGQSGIVIAWGEEDREYRDGMAWMRARFMEFNTQWAGIAIRGVWPFLSLLEEKHLLDPTHNPLAFAASRALVKPPVHAAGENGPGENCAGR